MHNTQVAAPIFNPPPRKKRVEDLVYEELRSAVRKLDGSEILVLSADSTPSIFQFALECHLAEVEMTIKLLWGWPKELQIHLIESKSEVMIGNLSSKGKVPANWTGTLETFLFQSIRKAFESLGYRVVEGLPSRYDRGWVI